MMFYLYFIIGLMLLILMRLMIRQSRIYQDRQRVRVQAIYPLMQSGAIRPVDRYKPRF